jgi:hypothetical protein
VISTDLTPPRPELQMKRSFLVFAEEPAQHTYLEWLRQAYDHSLLSGADYPQGLDFEKALARIANARNAERRKGTHFDEVWCMASFPSPAALSEAIDAAEHKKVRLAGTVGSFSTWFRLHWEVEDPVPSPLIGELSVEGFETILTPRIQTAVRRSAELPAASTVHLLLAALQSSADGFVNPSPKGGR